MLIRDSESMLATTDHMLTGKNTVLQFERNDYDWRSGEEIRVSRAPNIQKHTDIFMYSMNKVNKMSHKSLCIDKSS